MKGFKTLSLATQVFEKLESNIVSGVYPRGEVLTELKLVEQLGVSRTPIREALQRLEQERLIEDTGKGSVVLGITEQDLVDIMDVRYQLEGTAAYYATQNATEAELDELHQITELQEFYYSKKDFENLRLMDDRFHEAIYQFSGHKVIQDILVSMHRKSQRYRRISISNAERTKKVVQEHYAIYEAMADRNPELAKERIMNHIARAKKSMVGE